MSVLYEKPIYYGASTGNSTPNQKATPQTTKIKTISPKENVNITVITMETISPIIRQTVTVGEANDQRTKGIRR